MRIAIGHLSSVVEEQLRFVQQLGVEDIIFTSPALPGEDSWDYEVLLDLRMRCEDFGLNLAAIENVPLSFYDKAMLGLPETGEQIRNMTRTISHIGKAGIGTLGYHWMPSRVWRSGRATLRGGATSTSFDIELVDRQHLTHGLEVSEADMWRNYERYLAGILPAAEDAGVRLALHPDDPPVESLGGIARLFRNFENFRRALESFDSPMHGLNFCIGCWSEMGENVPEVIRYFGSRGKLFYVHFRDVAGVVPAFNECFLDEGNCDMLAVVDALKQVSFAGVMMPDHVPLMVNDTPWGNAIAPNSGGYMGRAYSVGYMRGLISARSGKTSGVDVDGDTLHLDSPKGGEETSPVPDIGTRSSADTAG